jgi:NADPH:quinone reductase-like Zn-dependent oxidoreductase
VRFHEYGPPQVLKYEEIEKPTLQSGDALIRVMYCGTNRFDTRIRAGAFKSYLPHILGTDVAGEVAEVATGVTAVKPGDRVIVFHIMNDDECVNCLSGRQNICEHSHMLGAFLDGGYSEYMKIRASNLIKIDELDFKIAACIPMNFGVAWNGLVSKANISEDDTVLIWGASSGVGSAAIIVAKLFGAKVITTANSAEKINSAKNLGADLVINYISEDVPSAVMSFTNNKGATIAFDHIGNGGWSKSIDSLAKGGTLVALGVTGGSKTEVDVGKVYHKELVISGIYGGSKGDMRKVIEVAKEGKVKPVIFKEMKLEDAQLAHQMIEEGSKFGKILLKP